MTTSLRDIPGAKGRRLPPAKGSSRARTPASYGSGGQAPLGMPPRRRQLFERRRQVDWFLLVLMGAIVALGAFLAVEAWSATRVDADVEGVVDGAQLTGAEARGMALSISVDPADRLDSAELTFDGESILDDAITTEDGFQWTPAELGEGEHRLELVVPRPFLSPSHIDWTFTVDRTAPRIEVPRRLPPSRIDQPIAVSGIVPDGSTLVRDGEEIDLDDGNGFELRFDSPPAGPITLVATDEAGNRTTVDVMAPLVRPSVRGVHVSAAAWADEGLRNGVIALIDQGRVDTIELDIKDEGGDVGHTTRVALAREIDAADLFDLREAVDYFHSRNLRVVGRLVAFRDPRFVTAALARGDNHLIVQAPDGTPFPSYGDEGFVNFAHPDVWKYNIDLAVEAADAGVDEILYDYIRRPEPKPMDMVVPGMEGSPTDAVVGFLAQSHPLLRERGVYQGASVFGISASRPGPVAQDIPRIAKHTDFISPMLYPALWTRGEYRVAHPNAQPYDIVKASLQDFLEQTAESGTPLVPWLQDFSLGIPYGRAEVQAQVQAAAELGVPHFLLWDPRVTYTPDGLDPIAP